MSLLNLWRIGVFLILSTFSLTSFAALERTPIPACKFVATGSAKNSLGVPISNLLVRAFKEQNADVSTHALLSEILTPNVAHWFQHSIEFPSADVDPLYVQIARKQGGVLFLGGGSDLIDTIIHREGKTSQWGLYVREINIVDGRTRSQKDNDYDQDRLTLAQNMLWQGDRMREAGLNVVDDLSVEEIAEKARIHDFILNRSIRIVDLTLGAYRRRPRVKDFQFQTNNESGTDLETMVRMFAQGRYIYGNLKSVLVPIKHGHLLRINEDGTARLFFRTYEDYLNYEAKILTLPEETKIPHEYADLNFVKEFSDTFTQVLRYNLLVYGRARTNGWQLSPISLAWLQNLAGLLQQVPGNKPKYAKMLEEVKEKLLEQGVSKEQIEKTLLELKAKPGFIWRFLGI